MFASCCCLDCAVSLGGGMCGPSAKIISSTPITDSTSQITAMRRTGGAGSVPVGVVIGV